MVLGIPPYRLRSDLLQDEIRAILDMGVELRTGVRLGADFSLSSLRAEGFSAVFLGIGCMRGRDLQIPGVETRRRASAVDFLLNANLGYRVDLGERVVVVGGGNVALDAARTALRQAPREAPGDRRTTWTGGDAIDEEMAARRRCRSTSRASRSGWERAACRSSRSRAARRCRPTSSRSRRPRSRASRSSTRLGPKSIVGDDHVEGLETLEVTSVFDPDGRFNPKLADGTESIIAVRLGDPGHRPGAGAVLARARSDGVELTPRGTIAIDAETLATSAAGIYAGGDVAVRPAQPHRRDRRRAPRGGLDPPPDRGDRGPRPSLSGRKLLPIVEIKRAVPDYTSFGRVPVPAEPSARRIGSPEIELGYTEEQAQGGGRPAASSAS